MTKNSTKSAPSSPRWDATETRPISCNTTRNWFWDLSTAKVDTPQSVFLFSKHFVHDQNVGHCSFCKNRMWIRGARFRYGSARVQTQVNFVFLATRQHVCCHLQRFRRSTACVATMNRLQSALEAHSPSAKSLSVQNQPWFALN